VIAPCHCGHCQKCVSDARWERIYREKFEDPAYYSREREPRGPQSSLGETARPLPCIRGNSERPIRRAEAPIDVGPFAPVRDSVWRHSDPSQ
jgi:hypothetical protein